MTKETWKLIFSLISHVTISCDCQKASINGFPAHVFFTVDVVSVVLMAALLDVQSFGKLPSSSRAVKDQKLTRW